MSIIQDIWPTTKALADDLGIPYTTAHSWKLRGRIPADRDFDLIDAAAKRGRHLSVEQLALARSARTTTKGGAA